MWLVFVFVILETFETGGSLCVRCDFVYRLWVVETEWLDIYIFVPWKCNGSFRGMRYLSGKMTS